MIVKVCWSGGKDSTAAMLLHLRQGDAVKGVFYIPYLTAEIPLIRKAHYEFIMSARDRFTAMGAEMYQALGITYLEHTHHIITKGERCGRPMGAGLGFGFCLFRDYSKRDVLRHALRGGYDYQDIAIAADEPKRQGQIDGVKTRSILMEQGYTERMARDLCEREGLLSPNYRTATRDGCAICPNAKPSVLLGWLSDYPEAEGALMNIEAFCRRHSPDNHPYRGRDGCLWWSDIIAKYRNTPTQIRMEDTYGE